MLIGPVGGVVELCAAGEHGYGDAHGHENENSPENGVEAPDNGINRHDGGQKIIGKDDHDPELHIHPGRSKLGQQTGRSCHKDHTYKHQQNSGKDAHHLFGGAAQVVSHDFRYIGPVIAHGKHA